MDTRENITSLKGVGEKTAKLFAKLNIQNIEELLHNYPRDYETFSQPTQFPGNFVLSGHVLLET